ncbi:MAG: peptidylprolyl isomerase, partial [Dinghuibacter sp.]|nr:peptidylprolyl isomerase [Dinghuibacter sp.]
EPVTGRIVVLETDFGNMTIALSDSTPKHRDNFIKLVKQGFYDSLLFHRVIKDFMIQGGDPDSKYAKPGQRLGNGGPGYTVPAEFNDSLFHKKGVIAAARLGDNVNPQKASSGCQFYIVQGKSFSDFELDQLERSRLGGKKIPQNRREIYKKNGGTPHLDGGYTVFGEVTAGWEVIDKIAAVAKDGADRPVTDVRMRIRIVH